MAVITDVRETRGLVAISADGTVFIRLRKKHYDKTPLSVGEIIDEENYMDKVAALQFNDAYEAALTSLDFAERTAKNLESSLIRKGYIPRAAEAVVCKLCEAGLVDDKRVANRVAESAVRKPVGVNAVKRKLIAKGISLEEADEALSKLDNNQQINAARLALGKLERKYADLPPREARSKLAQALARRGFSWSIISNVLDDLNED